MLNEEGVCAVSPDVGRMKGSTASARKRNDRAWLSRTSVSASLQPSRDGDSSRTLYCIFPNALLNDGPDVPSATPAKRTTPRRKRPRREALDVIVAFFQCAWSGYFCGEVLGDPLLKNVQCPCVVKFQHQKTVQHQDTSRFDWCTSVSSLA